ncbi:Ig-like domain-containing protein [Flavobacterium sp. J372]|uniref:Ig-like domain-containing protein n=1 Tax=Flavobacterium sp. J372 TaxID=2898436 RepID=UPI0021514E52|nr:Ig-like domain-containing protein [Flavobacterium sp. J372]MCR5861266.1 Ig-like domain-containing protein [Flavobacterium sp. J372]
MTTNFTGNQIRIDFNEYIKIKDVNKQLIISPPMNTAPDIVPTGSASKYINIKIKDTLQPNTTYAFNFGQSITDNNEGNPYSQFKFVFSTGAYIDSLTLNGRIRDAYSKETDDFVSVMLYEANEKFNDSTIYKEKPRYVTNTLDSVVDYSLQNLKEGKYFLVAIKDKNSNYRFDPKNDKIGFLPKPITIPTDTLYVLDLFSEVRPFKVLKPLQASQNKLFVPYEGDPRGTKATVRNGSEILPSVLTKVEDRDSLRLWIPRDIKADSLLVSAGKGDDMKDFTVRIKELKTIDSLSVRALQSGGLNFREKFTLSLSTPLVNIDNSKISLIKKDSSAVAFTTRYNDYEQKLEFDFVKEEEQAYTFMLMPGAMRDFYGKENDTLSYKLRTLTYADYGNLRISLENVNRFPLILQITNAKGDVQAEYYSEGQTQINFDAIKPDKYMLRVIYDDNKNREWDTGDYLQKRQPEEVIYYTNGKDDLIDVRANWDVEQPFNLGG